MSEDHEAERKGPSRRKRAEPPPRRRSVVPRLLISGAVVVLMSWASIYSAQVGRGPWQWTGEDWSGFVSFSRAQVEEARRKVETVDWDALAQQVTDKTKELWNKVPELEARLDERLAELQGKRASTPTGADANASAPAGGEAPAPSPDGGPATTPASGEAGAGTPPPAAVAPNDLELGCLAFREGIRHYRKSMKSKRELAAAKAKFEEAQRRFEAAHAAASRRRDAAARAEIEGYLQEVQTYLYDCSKRETL